MSFNSIDEIIADIREGKMVIIVDDEDRENEGDIIMASSMVRPQDINFMAQYGRGLICMTLTRERCKQLNLPLMVGVAGDSHGTNFTLSIEAAEGVTTGISAYDRAHTIRTAAAPNAAPDDVVQPGHIFPLMARPGGVLTRAGHTEAGCDLARLAGLEPSAAIVEILNEDGTMARRPDLEKFAAEHDLKIGTIEALIHYRIRHEKTVERIYEGPLPTEYGDFDLTVYRNSTGRVHFALSLGDVDDKDPVMVRVHIQDGLADGIPVTTSAFGWPLQNALKRIAEEGKGVAVVLRIPESDEEMIERLKSLNITGGRQQPQEEKKEDSPEDLRTYGIGAQILADLGINRMRLLSAPKKFHALGGFGLEVVEYIWEPVP